jgi:regulator of sigma E protease
MSIFSLVVFLLILVVLIFVHELGHFAVAKWTGMKVEEFSLGFFKPHLFNKIIGETKYRVSLLLLGGYVKILGENDDENASTNPRAFGNRPYLSQMAVLVAGVVMNMLLAYALLTFLAFGKTTVAVDDVRYQSRITNPYMMIADVLLESPAYKAGLRGSATLLSLKANGKEIPLTSEDAVVAYLGTHPDTAYELRFKNRNQSEIITTTIAPVYGLVPDKKVLGVSFLRVGEVRIGFFEAFTVGFSQTVRFTKLTLGGFVTLVKDALHGKNVVTSLSGPIGIASMVGDAAQVGYQSVLLLTAFLSINLAVLNIMPFPALDGGQMLKITLEKVLRRKLQHMYSAWLNGIGFILLIGLLLAVSVQDIMKLFHP